MTNSLNHTASEITRKELRELLGTEGLCISLFTAGSAAHESPTAGALRLKHLIAEAETQLTGFEATADQQRELLEPVRALAEDLPPNPAGAGLGILSGTGVFKVVHISSPMEDSATVGTHFEIRPLLREMDSNKAFYILALAQKNVRFLRCTDHSSEVVPFPDGVPTDLLTASNTDQPDHNLQSMSSAGPSSGSSKGIMQSTSTDREDKDENLMHFYNTIDKSLKEVLKAEPDASVVLVGVDYEIALFHKVSTHAHLVPDGVHGAPDGLKGGEMHKRALELIAAQPNPAVERALALYDSNIGAGRTSHQVNEVVRAAFEGRVSHLLLAEGAQEMGTFDDTTFRVRHHQASATGEEDLINTAAVQTILHDGQVFVLPKDSIPSNALAAAVLRY